MGDDFISSGSIVSESCPICLSLVEVQIGKVKEVIKVLGYYSIENESEVRKCLTCGEVYATGEQEQRNFEKIYQTFFERTGIRLPREGK